MGASAGCLGGPGGAFITRRVSGACVRLDACCSFLASGSSGMVQALDGLLCVPEHLNSILNFGPSFLILFLVSFLL
jgi:hypothetical protein